MTLKNGIKIGLVGTTVEAVGLVLDILHHLQIGIKTPEGLLTANHFIIFLGFLITTVGILLTLSFSRKNKN